MSEDEELITEQVFSPEEQHRVLELAARLQGSTANVTSSELNAAAKELDIQPAFLQEAIRRVKHHKDSAQGSDLTFRALSAGFLFAQWYAVFGILKGGWSTGFGSNGEHLWLVMGLSFVLGAIASLRKRSFWFGVGGIFASTIIMCLLSALLFNATSTPIHANWSNWFRNLLIAEGGLYLLGGLIGHFASGVIKKTNSKREEDFFKSPSST